MIVILMMNKKKNYEGVGYRCESHCMLCKSYCTLTKCGECGFRLLLLPMMMMVMGVWVLFQFRDFLGADLCRTCSFRYFQVIFKQKIFSSSTHVMKHHDNKSYHGHADDHLIIRI